MIPPEVIQRYLNLIDRERRDPGAEGRVAAKLRERMEAKYPGIRQAAQATSDTTRPPPGAPRDWRQDAADAFFQGKAGPRVPPPTPQGAADAINAVRSFVEGVKRAAEQVTGEERQQQALAAWARSVRITHRLDRAGALRVEIVIPDGHLHQLGDLARGPDDVSSALDYLGDEVALTIEAAVIDGGG